jgi:uncharacterized protein YdhG (YjbR/CyaY superfamily)
VTNGDHRQFDSRKLEFLRLAASQSSGRHSCRSHDLAFPCATIFWNRPFSRGPRLGAVHEVDYEKISLSRKKAKLGRVENRRRISVAHSRTRSEHIEQSSRDHPFRRAAETTEIISYGIPAFKSAKVVVWYAGFTEHWSLFPSAPVIEQFRNELKAYRVSKGTIQFPIDELPSAPLIKKLVKARLAQLRS